MVMSRGSVPHAIYFKLFAHAVCETSFVFYVSTLIFFVRCLSQNLIDLQNGIIRQFSNTYDHLAIKNVVTSLRIVQIKQEPRKNIEFVHTLKFQKLLKAMIDINSFSGEFILLFFSLSLLMMITLLHVVIISLLAFGRKSQTLIESSSTGKLSTIGSDSANYDIHWHGELLQRGLLALISAFVFAAMKVGVLVSVGEDLKKVREEFILSLDFIDPCAISSSQQKQDLQDLKQLVNKHKFQINACGFFVVDRKLVVTMIGSMITFIVVLVQFRSTE
ncbi:Gustatory and odorant receptor 21a [Folsomia candida]|uniref:Gustatory and odorant receptor 21a n=1 Tax=Folsomia candida TaxID=158441 RepID=A0A226F589_FOLCA|nr:Gustatory and odorant receptor 21a [Folsomia candida]